MFLKTPDSSDHQNQKESQAQLIEIPDILLSIDTDGTFRAVNSAFASYFNRTIESFKGVNVFEYLSSLGFHDLAAHRKAMADITVRSQRQVTFYDEQKGRTWRHTIYPIIDKDIVSHLVIITQDVTEIKRNEKKQDELQLQWDITARQCHIGMWKVDIESGCVTRGKEHAEIFGELPDRLEWSVNKFLESVVPEERPRIAEIYTHSLKEQKDVNFDCRIRRKDGEIRWVNVIGSFQFNEQGKAISVVGTTIDINDKKLMQLAYDNMQEQLRQSQKLEVLGQLAGGIAHDFNNVLAVIQGNTELVIKDLSPAHPHYQNLDSIIRTVKHSAEMVKQLLAFARKQPIRPKYIKLDAELEMMSPILGKMLREDISLNWQLNCPNLKVNLDPSTLVQIVTNLCVNARDAIEGAGLITIQTTNIKGESCKKLKRVTANSSGEYIRIRISDTGSGIDPKVLPHIFEPFFTTKGIGRGTGLGLPTVYGLVKQNSGHITCESILGTSTIFDIFFPIAQQNDTSGDDTEQQIKTASSEQIMVLFVEDEPEVLKIVKSVLENNGFIVLTAGNAEDAIEIARENRNKIKLTISDILLPGMNGVQMSKKLQELNPQMKFVFMSGYSAKALGEYGKISGNANFISKPFSIINFLNMVHTVMATDVSHSA